MKQAGARRECSSTNRVAIVLALVGLAGCFEWHGDAATDAATPAAVDAGVDVSLCSPQDVTRSDTWMSCMSAATFYWNGAGCLWIGDCACAGSGCATSWPTFDECMEAHAACLGTRPCTSATDCGSPVIPPLEYCHLDGAPVCGAPGRCWPRPAQPLDCGFARDPTCGCSIAGFFGNRCRAHLLGTDGAPGCSP